MTHHFVADLGNGIVNVRGDAPTISLGEHGAIIGHLFSRSKLDNRIVSLSAEQIATILSTSGRSLIQDFWGGYVAIIKSADGCFTLLRDPSGIMPCYWKRDGSEVRCSNDIEDVAGWARPANVDISALAHYLGSPGYNGERTGLTDTCELPAGYALQWQNQHCTVAPYWSPWDFIGDASRISFADAAEQLQATVQKCVEAWAGCFDKVVIGVSGGLDSSIVASMANSRTTLTCLNMFADDAEGDERHYAQILTDHLGLELATGHFELEDIDVERAIIPHRPWPNVGPFALSNQKRHQELAEAGTVDAFFSGNGGDNIFCATRSTSPFLDRLKLEGPGAGLKSTLRDLCLLTETDTGTVLKAAWQQYLKSRKGPPPKTDPAGLARNFCPTLPLQHPWKSVPSGAPIGKIGHIGFLAGAQQSHELYARGQDAPHIAPLLSQPIVELCLSIPTWHWVQGGVDRAVARAAFAGHLPEQLIRRWSKGGPGMFVQQIYRDNEPRIKSFLNDGLLAREGVLDPAYINAQDDLSWRGNAKAQRLLQFAGAEAWCRYWQGRILPDRSGTVRRRR